MSAAWAVTSRQPTTSTPNKHSATASLFQVSTSGSPATTARNQSHAAQSSPKSQSAQESPKSRTSSLFQVGQNSPSATTRSAGSAETARKHEAHTRSHSFSGSQTYSGGKQIQQIPKGKSSGRSLFGRRRSFEERHSKTFLERANQSKFIQDRITQVEKHFGDICTGFGEYSRRASKLRDSGDVISQAVSNYANDEKLNHTTVAALTNFAENFSAVQDYRNAEVKRIEGKVLEPLTLYGKTCKDAKERLKQAFAARDKEVKAKKKLDDVKDKTPSNRHEVSVKESELHKASVNASYTSQALEEEMDRFERQKLKDIKDILKSFVNIELLYHSKALEMFTLCYQSLDLMDEDEDLEEFRNSLRPPTLQNRLEMHRSGSHQSLNTTTNSGGSGTTPGKKNVIPSPATSLRSTGNFPPSAARPNPGPRATAENGDDDDEEEEEYTDDDDDDDDDDEVQAEYEKRFNSTGASAASSRK